MKKQLVTAKWLHTNQLLKNLIILDASPSSTVGGKVAPFPDLSIPNARKINIKEELTNKEGEFPNTVPTEVQFDKVCRSLGINKDSKIVVYDNLGIYTSPRVWWLLKVMGHKNVAVLDGGLPEWIEQGYGVVNTSDIRTKYTTGNFKSKLNDQWVIQFEDVVYNNAHHKFTIVDARSSGRFDGTAPEPRQHLQSGHIPNSINIPFTSLLENGKFKSAAKLKAIFKKKTSEKDQLIFSCGSGLTACIVMLASEVAFKKSPYLYDGSWTEYAELQGLTLD